MVVMVMAMVVLHGGDGDVHGDGVGDVVGDGVGDGDGDGDAL
jgi:hypothetical protein